MRSLLRQLTFAAVILAHVPGCSLMPWDDAPVMVEDVLLPEQTRGVALDESQIPSYAAVRATVGPLLSEVSQPLTAAECACRAAASSELASVLDQEAAHLRRECTSQRRGGVSHLLPSILTDQAYRERNDAAQQALIAYYQLAEIELQQGVVAECYQERQRTQETVDGLYGAGLAEQFDRSELDRQRLALDERSLQLTHDQARLTGLVKTLVGDDPFSSESIDTECAIEPRPPQYALPEAVEIGRANDVQLRAIRRFLHEGDTEDLDLARSLLQTANPLLGQTASSLGLCAKLQLLWGKSARNEQELVVRKRQLRAMYESRQQQVDLEVADALVNAQHRFLDATVAKDLVDSWQRHIAVLESNREVQRSTYAELVAARTELLQARSQLLHKVMELEIAHVKVQGTLGVLVDQCTGLDGYATRCPE